MVVWHVCSFKKLCRYIKAGLILSPIRAWRNIESAERFSKQTGRRIIVRLKFPDSAATLPGHKGEAVFVERDLDFPQGGVL